MTDFLGGRELQELHDEVQRALKLGSAEHLKVLGYGEISCVVAWTVGESEFACKRLPPFRDPAALEDYESCVIEYLDRLSERGVTPIETKLERIRADNGEWFAYCVQPIRSTESLGPSYLARCTPEQALEFFGELLDLIEGCVCENLGLDGQLSNWIVTSEGLEYLDITTPMLRDEEGREKLDTQLFIASLPWALRGLVRKVFLHQILDKYYDERGVILDFLGNLHKEGLTGLLLPFMDLANGRVQPEITEREILEYYREDARMWALLQRLRHADRTWQRSVRRRVYPFLLPGKIVRNI